LPAKRPAAAALAEAAGVVEEEAEAEERAGAA